MTIDTVRDPSGRFLPGNSGGPGRPKRETEEAILNAIRSALSPAEIEGAIRIGLQLAIEQKSTRGIVAILELAASYSIGRPVVRLESNGSSRMEEDMQRWIELKKQAGIEQASG